MKNLSMIVAKAKNNVIGVNNTLPWHLPEDLKRFKGLTMGHHIIMGRKTFESLGRLLPGRTTVIVSRNENFSVQGAIVANSVEQALALCGDDDEPFLIGGEQLYHAGLSFVNRLYITEVDLEIEGDAFLPEIDLKNWNLVEKKDHLSISGLNYTDYLFTRI